MIKVGGMYKHFKGDIYLVLNKATHSESNEELVIYKNIHNGSNWARPLSMFEDKVTYQGAIVNRFEYINP